MAYTTAQKVGDYLGVDLTGLQLTQVDTLLPAADDFINRYCARTFGSTTPIVAERYTPQGALVFLRSRPVASVQAVRSRPWRIGAASTSLVPSVSYELIDPDAGILEVSSYAVDGFSSAFGGAVDGLLEVDYTPAQTTPADVGLAASMLVAHWLRPHLVADGITPDIKRYSVGQELTVEYRDDASSGAAPSSVTALLAPYRQMVFA